MSSNKYLEKIASWVPAAVGASIGAAGGALSDKDHRVRNALVGGLAGGIGGVAAGKFLRKAPTVTPAVSKAPSSTSKSHVVFNKPGEFTGPRKDYDFDNAVINTRGIDRDHTTFHNGPDADAHTDIFDHIFPDTGPVERAGGNLYRSGTIHRPDGSKQMFSAAFLNPRRYDGAGRPIKEFHVQYGTDNLKEGWAEDAIKNHDKVKKVIHEYHHRPEHIPGEKRHEIALRHQTQDQLDKDHAAGVAKYGYDMNKGYGLIHDKRLYHPPEETRKVIESRIKAGLPKYPKDLYT